MTNSTATIQSLSADQVKPGMVLSVVRHKNALGQTISPIRKWDWRVVTITTENLAQYTNGENGEYWFQPATSAQLLTAAGFRKIPGSTECGEELAASGSRLNGLACKKTGTWAKAGEPDRCLQHAVKTL